VIGAALLALPGIALLAAGTPRQAEALFRGRLREPRRRACRIAGLCLLAASLCLALGGGERARHLIGWVGATGIEALLVALLLAVPFARRRGDPRT
jgi:hypothetical protein